MHFNFCGLSDYRMWPAILAATLLVGACANAGSSQSPTTMTSTSSTTVGVDISTSTVSTAPPPTHAPEDDVPTISVETVVTPEGTPIDIHQPEGQGPWPVVVFLHGSPPTTKEDVGVVADWIAGRGALVYNVGWTEGGFDGVDGSVENVACSVAFTRQTASEHGGDASRITLVGMSAGGWAGSAVALGGKTLSSDCVGDENALPEVFVGINGAYSGAVDGPPAEMLADNPEALHAIDPYTYIGENPDLEVWLIHGDADTEQPISVAEDFSDALLSSGYTVELVVLQGVGHDSGLSPEQQDELVSTIMTAAQG
jgi:predicted esterase